MMEGHLGGSRPGLSVVIPCYNEHDVLPETHRRVKAVCDALGRSYEIVLVNDGSGDSTWKDMQELAQTDPSLVLVNLSRNHGHQLALMAGLHVCRGERVLTLDADLQDPPELLPEMLSVMEQGADVVYGQRRSRPGDAIPKRFACAVFYRLLRWLSDAPIRLDTGDFRLISRRALDVVLQMPDRQPFVRGMVSWIGFRQQPLLYDRDARFAGETKYPLSKLIKLALDGLASSTVKPLTVASTLAAVAGGLGVLCLLYALASLLFVGTTPHGWTSLMMTVCLIGTAQLLLLSIMGGYLARLFEQNRRRPPFIIEQIVRSGARSDGSGGPQDGH